MYWDNDRGLRTAGSYQAIGENRFVRTKFCYASIGDYKQAVEADVATSFRLGGTLAFGSTLMEDIMVALLPGVTILQAYTGMKATARRPYDILYMNLIMTIIMTKNYNYNSLRKWLAQNKMIPGTQAYTTKSNELVEMTNSR